MKVATGMVVPVFLTLHMKSNSSRQWIGMGVLVGGIPGSVVRGQGLTSKDVMLESTMSEVLVVLEGHDDDDEDSNWTTNFYLPRSCTISKSGLILSYFPDWLIIRWFHFFCFCLFFLVWLYLLPKCIYT